MVSLTFSWEIPLVMLLAVQSVVALRIVPKTIAAGHLRSSASTFEDVMPETVTQPQLPNLEQRRPLKVAILALAARTARGEIATENEKVKCLDLINKLESLNPIPSPASSDAILGTWDLVWSDTHLFRSSPLFMAGRAVCKNPEEARRFDFFCQLHRDALAFTQIGKVVQKVTETTLTSEFEARGNPLIGLPGPFVSGTIQSSAEITFRGDSHWELFMDRIRIKKDTSNVPLLKSFLDDFEGIPTRSLSGFLESTINLSAPRPRFFTTYLDTHMRISRDQDDKVFVYNRVV